MFIKKSWGDRGNKYTALFIWSHVEEREGVRSKKSSCELSLSSLINLAWKKGAL